MLNSYNLSTKLKLIPIAQKQSVHWQKKYLATLSRPMDGMWLQRVQNEQFWKINHNQNDIGFFATTSTHTLLQYFIEEEYRHLSDYIFNEIIQRKSLKRAMVSTADALLLTATIEKAYDITCNDILFQIPERVKLPQLKQETLDLRLATSNEEEKAITFYTTHVGSELLWTMRYTKNVIEKQQLYFVYLNQEFVGIGEYRASQWQPPFVDLGMAVVTEFRKQQVGTKIMLRLLALAKENNKRAICSCTQGNVASEKVLLKAGFIPSHKYLRLEF